jgi:hypothetical protein
MNIDPCKILVAVLGTSDARRAYRHDISFIFVGGDDEGYEHYFGQDSDGALWEMRFIYDRDGKEVWFTPTRLDEAGFLRVLQLAAEHRAWSAGAAASIKADMRHFEARQAAEERARNRIRTDLPPQ